MSPAISRRHAFRATWHPYNDGIYFVTICCRDKKCMLGRISDDRMTLSELGMIVDDCIISIPTHFPEVEIWNHIVMPNHIHMVVYVGPQYIAPASASASTSSVNCGCLRPPNHGEECENYHHNSRLSVIVGAFKAAVTRTARRVLQNSILDSIKLIKQKPQLSQAEAFLCPQSFVTLWQSIKKLHKVNV